MKNLSNCELAEFLKQTNKIRKQASKWIIDTKIMEIRKRVPDLTDLTEDEKKAKLREQGKKNISDILDNALDTHPQETAELLGLMCFVEPKDLNKHKTAEYLKAFGEMISDEDVLDFFTSLMRLEQTGILSTVSK